MSKDNGESAFPIVYGANGDMGTDGTTVGLTKREYFAGLALQAIITSGLNHKFTAELAVEYADELIKALEADW